MCHVIPSPSPVILSEAKNLRSSLRENSAGNLALRTVGKSIVEGRRVNTSCPLTLDSLARQNEIPRCHENGSAPQREEGQGWWVSVPVNHPLPPPYQVGESLTAFSFTVVSRKIMKSTLGMTPCGDAWPKAKG
jgi:hypothetical protein